MAKKRAKSKRLTPTEQHARFVEAAKNAEADEAPDALDKAFRRLNVAKSLTAPPQGNEGRTKPRRSRHS